MDLHCARCGEPWDTRGLHHSHFDMDPNEAFFLVNGWNCPCCAHMAPYEIDRNDQAWAHKQWTRDVERASEGSVYIGEDTKPLYQSVSIEDPDWWIQINRQAIVSRDEMGIEHD